MQFAELLLWFTNPRKSCTTINKIITLTLIPLVLFLQSIGSILGSFFVTPWKNCSDSRKSLIIWYSVITLIALLVYFYGNLNKVCTTVTRDGHLNWWPSNYSVPISFIAWAIMIIAPLIVLWDASYKMILFLIIVPAFGFFLRVDYG